MQAGKLSFTKGQKIVNGKYTIHHKIGEEEYSLIHSVILGRKEKQILRAIKAQPETVRNPQIRNQIAVLKSLQEIPQTDIGFTKFFQFGTQRNYHYMIMELLGPNLQQLLRLCNGKISLKTVSMIGLQIIDRIETLHSAGWVYRNIQPKNFLIGLGTKSAIIHMIDFGKCRRYRNKEGQHFPYKENVYFDGPVDFSSLNTHCHIEYSRRDDIQALIYMMIYLRKGKLPWQLVREYKSKKDKENTIDEIKNKVTPEQLSYKLPLEFADLITYVRTLNYFERPDYDYVRTMIYRMFTPDDNINSFVYDWNRLETMDFDIYPGQPKIALATKTQITNNEEENEIEEVNQKQEQDEYGMEDLNVDDIIKQEKFQIKEKQQYPPQFLSGLY